MITFAEEVALPRRKEIREALTQALDRRYCNIAIFRWARQSGASTVMMDLSRERGIPIIVTNMLQKKWYRSNNCNNVFTVQEVCTMGWRDGNTPIQLIIDNVDLYLVEELARRYQVVGVYMTHNVTPMKILMPTEGRMRRGEL